ncbi:MAG: FTR1 family protein [bacterium]|nr:FTR1 family protein [bacterium]
MTDFIITFRETLEAALVAGIVLSYLAHIEKKSWFSVVYWAIAAGVILSVAAGYAFETFLGGFQGKAEEIYEGVIMLLAAALISWMILWMIKQRHKIKAHLQQTVDRHVETENKIGVFILVFLAVLREGIETVLFLQASALQAGGNSVIAAALGIVVAIAVGYILFSGLKKMPIQQFFTVTTIILILFAAGLVAHGIHELQEAGWIPFLTQQAWDLNPAVITEGIYPLLHENGAIGSLLKHVFGWNGNPSQLEVLSYLLYLGVMAGVMRMAEKK